MLYQNILLVTDLKPDADVVAQKAKNMLTSSPNAKLAVLNIVKDAMVGFGYELVPVASLYETDPEQFEQAQTDMLAFLKRNNITSENTNISTAMSNSEGIISYCKNHNVDLIVIGRHERHGLSAFLNSATVDGILPNVNCDVLVVHLDQ